MFFCHLFLFFPSQRPKTGCKVCKECFISRFEEEVHHTIITNKIFERGETVAIGASGGKDSTVLAHVMTTLNKRYDYGLNLFLLSIDEGIAGYRDDSLETVKRNQEQYGIPLKIVSYKELYGWSMDEIVRRIGTKNNCTFCGVFRRQALDRGAQLMNASKLLTGHNCDDMAETVLMNILRGDIARLGRCVDIVTGRNGVLPRAKPFKFTYEKEIVMYAYFLKLDYFSTECKYSPFAYRGFAREFMKDLERSRPRALLDIITSAEYFAVAPKLRNTALKRQPNAQLMSATDRNRDEEDERVDQQNQSNTRGNGALSQAGKCTRCNYMSSQIVCKACVLLESLEVGDIEIATRGTTHGSYEKGEAKRQAKKKQQDSRAETCCGGTSCASSSGVEIHDQGDSNCCGQDNSCSSGKKQVPLPTQSSYDSAIDTLAEADRKAQEARIPKKFREPVKLEDSPETIQRLQELGLRFKEGETLSQALRRIKKEEGFQAKQRARAVTATTPGNDATLILRGKIEVDAEQD